jgi:hypothetical protein
MNDYVVAVLDGGTLNPHQRIEVEVQFARELERRLGGAAEVAHVCAAALRADAQSAVVQRWSGAVDAAALVARGEVGLRNLDFEVRLERVDESAGRRA